MHFFQSNKKIVNEILKLRKKILESYQNDRLFKILKSEMILSLRMRTYGNETCRYRHNKNLALN